MITTVNSCAFLFLQLRLMWSSLEWRKHERAYLQYIYCKIKPWIQRELSHTIKSRCACVWMYMVDICMVANLILLCSLETYLSFKIWKHLLESRAILFISFFSGGHLSTHCFRYLGHFCVHFFSSSFFFFSLSFFLMNRNSEIESEGRVWRRCRPVGALSMACTLVDRSST